ncbi:mucin-5AC-like [Sorex fumeus]|uniref:mucin-5AC-like n=1 Tax=Sorex fumeus TaxID=62283 RepID=UPI0024AD7F03|nr:mucin-5AC-like [Sorex fumeus]
MGLGRRKLAPLWALALALACARHTGLAQHSPTDFGLSLDLHRTPQSPAGDSVRGVTMLPPLRTVPVVRALNPAHNGRVCSTWGDFHYKTFDGAVFRFPGLCNYVMSAHCGSAYEDFNVQLRRCPKANATTLCGVTMKLDGVVLQLSQQVMLVNGNPVQLPFSQFGVTIEQSGSFLKVLARLGLVFMWNQDDSLLLELDAKYANQTCGLCGDFNGIPDLSEFFPHGVWVSPLEFGNLQKMDGPTEQCQDPVPEPPRNCSTNTSICEELLLGRLFSGCSGLVEPSGYLEACQQDVCACEHSDITSCVCDTLAEFSRQCAHAGGRPLDWRSPDLCPATCFLGMQHQECGSPCTDTCSNPESSQLCGEHCMAGCFCPKGTVFDDIGKTGCIPVSQCHCVHNGVPYAPGAGYSTDCTQCTCVAGRWSCQERPCPGTCAVLGGAHFSTFDERQYTVHGDCSYVLAKPLHGSAFSVLAELRRCGLSESETCLKSVTLSLDAGQTVVVIKASGEVFVNQIYTQLPVSAANVTLFRPSTFFIVAHTQLGLQLEVQLVPIMQVFVQLEPQLRGQTCGLCGNFNQNQADDFRALSGVVEGTAAAFANTWKTQASCPNVRNSFEDPCSLSVENEKYAERWCSRLTDAQGPFAPCHAVLNPTIYYSNCMFDTCNCEKSEDCMCAALSSYVHACAAKGVLLDGWRDGACMKPTTNCPKSLTYQYHIRTCQPTCRARGGEDITCAIGFVPVDGCTCPPDTFLDDQGKCVPASSCPCYHGGSVVPSGETLHENGALCTCTQGTLTCMGKPSSTPVCAPPMVYVDCRNATPGVAGAACQKSCHTLDMDCYSTQCVAGCVCPDGLVADGSGGCVAEEECPCMHNEASYQRGQSIRVGCNTCTCENRKWRCTDEPCLATCAVYGDGHYLTFDGQRYSFSGDCEYTLLQDHCGGGNGSSQDALRVVTENVPCGSTGTTCSKAIKLFLGSFELRLSDGKAEVIEKAPGRAAPFSIRQMGIYLVVDTQVGLVLLWDKKTSLFLRLGPEFKGRVCGLCGNFDDKAINDFTTRGQSVVGNALEFGNSWKFSPSCPDAPVPRDPCTANPYRKSWAQKQCSLINSATFAACHAHVDPSKYYEACVSDACACDSGGDCECFCTAVAAYAQACHDVGVCVSWRTPDICPLFCDYYNPEGQCEWHYQPCGSPCMRTCRNPSGRCLHNLPGLEGCYPKCPPEAPIFDEDQMQCVATCPPPPPAPCQVAGQVYLPGAQVPAEQNCQSCMCTESGVTCVYDSEACVCTYGGLRFHPGDSIYNTTDGTGGCIYAHCGTNGTIERRILECPTTTSPPPTTFTFSTHGVKSTPTPSTHPSPRPTTDHPKHSTTSPELPTTTGCGEVCQWSPWLDVSRPGQGRDSGDFDTLDNLRAHGHWVCQAPREVQCRAEDAPEVPLEALGQRVQCSLATGLTCFNKEQTSGLCHNYQVRVLCCSPRACPPASSTTRTTPRHHHSTPSPTPATTTPPPDTTPNQVSCLHERCSWTSWIDGSYPQPDRNGGDFDTFSNLRAKGYHFCQAPSRVECRAERFPDTPLADLGQTLVCDTQVGLLCLNKDQLPPICYNYQIRIQCCELVDECGGTTTPVSSTTRTTPKSHHSMPSPTPVTTTAPPDTTPNQVSCLHERCSWTSWIDGSYPQPDRNGGDFDTFSNLRAKGYHFCQAPSRVECRAERFPDTPLADLGQTLVCDTQVGLLCLNKDQLPPICYNYQIRIQCCELVDECKGSNTTPYWKTIPTASTPHVPPQATSTATTHRTTGTSACQPQCSWTHWVDVDFPTPGPHGGDFETYKHIISRGEKVCGHLDYINGLECRAENHPDVSIDQLGQVVQCHPDVGLVCRNKDQKGPFKMCLNYEIRVLCCEPQKNCPVTPTHTVPATSTTSSPTTSTTSSPTTSTTSSPTTSTTSSPTTSTTSSPTTSTTSSPTTSTTSSPTTSTTSSPTTSTTSSPTTSTTSSPTTSTTSSPTTSTTSSPTTSTTSSPTTSTTSSPTTSTTSSPTTSTTSSPTTSTTSSPTTSTTSSPTTSTTSSPTTSTTSSPITSPSSTPVTTTTPASTSETSHTTPGTSACQPQCSWTHWVDVDFPTPGPHGGDFETYKHIISRGEKVCGHLDYINGLECRAENHPDVSIDQLGQVVQCHPDVGLVCRNKDQKGPFKMCLNYEIRVLCCEPQKNCPVTPTHTVPATSTTSSPTTSTTSSPTTSTTSSPTTSTTSSPTTSTTSSPTTSTTSSPTTSTTSSPTTSTTSSPTTSTTSSPTTSTTSSPTTSTTSSPTTSTTSSPTTSTTSTPVTTTTPASTSETSHTTPGTSVTHTVTSTPAPSSVPPTCFCSVSDKFYPAGSIIYQEKDLSGHCYYAVCSLDCHVVRGSDQTCHTSTPPAPATSLTVPTSFPPSPVSDVGCPNAVPPRKRGETWPMANCSQATCEGNHVISLYPRPCPPPVMPTCANGYPAMIAADKDGCCPQFQCQCVCSGWGDPHYITFDGTYYTFLDNCTYVLVQQIVPVFGHFRVLIENYFCDAEDGLSCPQAITVEYRQARVTLTRRPVLGQMTNQILFNSEVVSPGFQKDGLVISQVGVKMFVRIPELGVRVMFSGLIFSVEVPFSKFANNTEGQCGTCTNDQKDECRLPGGTTVSSCSDMSRYWKVTTPDQPSCQGPPPAHWNLPTPSPGPCPSSPICELILSEVFSACHTVIPPRPYYEGCVFDQCHVGNSDVVCSSLELYSSLCASHNLCIDWRGLTNHTCPFTCPDNKEYRPCGPANPTYCYGNASLLALPEGSISEGCFCPEGSILFSTSTEICVSTECTGCLGHHGEPVEPGQTVVADCQECTCDAASRTLTCRPQTCPPPPACPAPGLVPVPAVPQAGQCCPTYSCDCNASYCPEPMDCPEGFRLELSRQEGACCPTQTCVLIPGCSVNGTLYQPGTVTSWSLCETCRCEAHKGTPTDTFVLSCQTQICDSNCSLGFEYQLRPGECCGACVQVACVVNGSTQLRFVSVPGEIWSEPGNSCVSHTCEKHQDRFIVVTTKKACPPLSCSVEEAVQSEDGCCLKCPSQPQTRCGVHNRTQVIWKNGCRSAEAVSLTYCSGNCGDTASMYSPEAEALTHKCRCCQELRVSQRNVTLSCTDGSSQMFSYAHVEECGCVGLRCHRPGDQSQQLELEWAEEREEQPREAPGQAAGRWRMGPRGVAPHQRPPGSHIAEVDAGRHALVGPSDSRHGARPSRVPPCVYWGPMVKRLLSLHS